MHKLYVTTCENLESNVTYKSAQKHGYYTIRTSLNDLVRAGTPNALVHPTCTPNAHTQRTRGTPNAYTQRVYPMRTEMDNEARGSWLACFARLASGERTLAARHEPRAKARATRAYSCTSEPHPIDEHTRQA